MEVYRHEDGQKDVGKCTKRWTAGQTNNWIYVDKTHTQKKKNELEKRFNFFSILTCSCYYHTHSLPD